MKLKLFSLCAAALTLSALISCEAQQDVQSKRVFQELIVGPRPSEKPQGTKAEVPMDIGIGSIVDAGRQSHGALQPGEARATFETPSKRSRKNRFTF